MDEWNKRIDRIGDIISAAELCILGDRCSICPYREQMNCTESLQYDLQRAYIVLKAMNRTSYKVKAVKIDKIHI